MPGLDNFVAIIDSREQQPWDFSKFGVETVVEGLPTGDYAIRGVPGCVIERKSGPDLLGCIGGGRERFERELERMAEMDHAAIVCEAGLDDLTSGMFRSKVSPTSVVGSLLAWQLRHGIHIWLCPDRRYAERIAFKILERYWRDVADGKRPKLVETEVKNGIN